MDNNNKRNEVYSTSVKAGNRTYFFDIRENRKGDYFITICESRKIYDEQGEAKYEKSKIYLYQNAFEEFINGYADVMNYIKKHKPEYFEVKSEEPAWEEEIPFVDENDSESELEDI